jgi:hypothetical protein
VYQLLLTTRALVLGADGTPAGCMQPVGVSASGSTAAFGGGTADSLGGADAARVIINDATSVTRRSCVAAAPGDAMDEDRRAKSRNAAGVVAAASGSTMPLSAVSADTKQLDRRRLLRPRWGCNRAGSSGCWGRADDDTDRLTAPAGGEATGERDMISDAAVNSRSPSRTKAALPPASSATVPALPA